MKHIKRMFIRILYLAQLVIFIPVFAALAVYGIWFFYWVLTGRNVFSDYVNYQPLSFTNFLPKNYEIDNLWNEPYTRDINGKRLDSFFGTGDTSSFSGQFTNNDYFSPY